MKNFLKFEYNIDIDKVITEDDKYFFYIDYIKYYIYEIKRPIKDIDEIFKILKSVINNYYGVILNKNRELYTQINNKYYMVIKVNLGENDEINLREILKTEILLPDYKINNLYRGNWGELWEAKVDYLEYQVKELATNHPLIKNYFNYYVGLAENAIQYYNTLNLEKIPLSLSHKKIEYPNIAKNFYNPTTLIIDSRIRDIAEYLKSLALNNQEWENELELIIGRRMYSNTEYNLLFVRLLYPNYFFNLISNVLENDANDDEIIPYIDQIDKYEEFLKTVYFKITNICPLQKIDWLFSK